VRKNDDRLPDALPEAIEKLAVPALPQWVEPRRLRAAQRFASEHLVEITLALFCASLPLSYGSARGARVLAGTGRLGADIDRRINETAVFVLHVLAPNGLEEGGRGRADIGKVRLIHAAVRRSVPGDMAINQEDLLGALGVFSVVVLKSLVRLGITIDPRDREDFIHLWSAVGAMMGIRRELLPSSYAEAESVARRIGERQLKSSPEGRRLMQDLLSGMRRHLPGFGWAPPHVIRWLIGSQRAELLGVHRPPALPRMLAHFLQRPAPIGRLIGGHLLEAITRVKLGGEAAFPMPERDEGPSHHRQSGC
jgi:hypothetical protein